jgi:uncharacterized delta-60 repeat protein
MKTIITIVFALCVAISALLAQTPDKRPLDRDAPYIGMKHVLIDDPLARPTGGSHLRTRAYLPSDLREKFRGSRTLWLENFWGTAQTMDELTAEMEMSPGSLIGEPRRPLNRLPFLNEQTSTDIPQTAWVRHYASGLAPSDDKATAITVDNQGNVYVTGTSTKLPFGTDYLTIKYSSAGVIIWTSRYDGSGQGDDIPRAIAVDASGNVYVTGVSKGSGTSDDYATIKYDGNGNQLWAARYNGPGNSGDFARAIAVDGSGNVYVTGWSEGSGTSDDYATIKYDASGNQLWAARYNGPGNSGDFARAIAVDGSGNVYVTGWSAGSATSYDYATIKYDTSGNQMWAARYDGPGNSGDEANALAVDGSGNVYVTGVSAGSGTSYDYATIKYDTSGNQMWAARYNGPGNSFDFATALAVDGSGNVYVTGRSTDSDASDDYATIKYDATGKQLWAARYDGPGNSGDEANALAVDGSGNVYVTGVSAGSGTSYDYATIKYDTSGNQMWVGRYSGDLTWRSALAVDGSGNVYVAGARDSWSHNYATIKYSSSGNQLWVALYGGAGTSSDIPKALAIDGAGNVHLTGRSKGSGTYYDYATIKYNASGSQLWAARYNGPGNFWDEARALAVDGAGNVYVTGVSYGSGTDYDYATIKYDAGGNQLWAARYNGPANGSDEARAIAVDGSGNVYVTGSSSRLGEGWDYAIIKYDAGGNQLWVARYNGPDLYNITTALAVDGSGNVYVTGGSTGSGTNYDYATIKYNASGSQLWAARYNGPGNFWDEARALAVDGSGNVYVTGWSYGSGTSYDYATIKYDASGNQLWAARYNGPDNFIDEAIAIAVDGSGNVYVTGGSYGTGTASDYATVKYDAGGNQLWVARYDFYSERATALAVDGIGNVYVTGLRNAFWHDFDWATIKYDVNGNQIWAARYNVPGTNSDWGLFPMGLPLLAVDGSGNVYVTGSNDGHGWSVYTTIKYTQQTTSVEKIPCIAHQYSLEQNYPNPFNPSTVIKFQIPSSTFVTLNVFDMFGREIAVLVNEEKVAGNYSLEFNGSNLASGVYFYRLQAGNFVQTKKLVLLR